jgi:hypothetical protein
MRGVVFYLEKSHGGGGGGGGGGFFFCAKKPPPLPPPPRDFMYNDTHCSSNQIIVVCALAVFNFIETKEMHNVRKQLNWRKYNRVHHQWQRC